MQRAKPPRSSGFTLIELMVTLAVLGILASAAVPSFVETVRNNRISSQTNEALSVLLFARSEAIKRRETITVDFSAPEGGGWRAVVTTEGDDDLRIVDRGDSTVTISVASLTFTALGRSDNNELTVSQPNTAGRTLCIGMTGRAQAVKDSGDC